MHSLVFAWACAVFGLCRAEGFIQRTRTSSFHKDQAPFRAQFTVRGPCEGLGERISKPLDAFASFLLAHKPAAGWQIAGWHRFSQVPMRCRGVVAGDYDEKKPGKKKRKKGPLGGRVPPRQDGLEGLPGGQFGGSMPQFSPFEEDYEYADAVLDMKRAAARLESLERSRGKGQPARKPQRPRGARATVSRTDAGTLLIDVPAAGFSGGAMFGGLFSAVWFSAIVPTTASMLASGDIGSGLFMAPFWLAGGLVAKQTVLDPAKATTFSIGEYAWDIKQTVPGGLTVSSESGATEELRGANVDITGYVNGVPSFALNLLSGNAAFSIGDGLPVEELEWIADEVNMYLQSLEASS